MPGWCNGSAGYVWLWTLAHKVFGKEKYLDLAERAALEAWSAGGAGHSLCCGWAGQAYSQLALYRHTGAKKWREQAEELVLRAVEFGAASLREEGLPFSLYKGNVGVAVLAAEVPDPYAASMPFFEEEGWPATPPVLE
jgi:serine/threonine-protein kinase